LDTRETTLKPSDFQQSGATLVTGAAGWVGRYIVRRLIESQDGPVYVLIRPTTKEDAFVRVRKLAEFCREDSRIKLLSDDGSIPSMFPDEIETVIHAAAQVHFGGTSDIFESNVNLLWKLLHATVSSRNVKRFLHLSTCSIRTNARAPFRETDLDSGQQFVSPYDLTKYLAETLVQKFYLQLPTTIVRLGSVLATTDGSFPHTRDWFYQTIRLWLCQGVDALPLGEDQRIHPVPVDTLAECLCDLIALRELPPVLHVPCLPGPSMKRVFECMAEATGHPPPRLFAQHEESWQTARCTMPARSRGLIDRLYPPPPPGQKLASMDSCVSQKWMMEHGLPPTEVTDRYWGVLAESVRDQAFPLDRTEP
jgi:nucleoside-diphosphate-sugar epimerase